MTVEPYDDLELAADELVIRRISPAHHVVWDENIGGERLSTKAFSPSSDANGGMSVDLKSFIEAAGHDPAQYVTSPRFLGSVEFTIGAARAVNLRVGRTPQPHNPHHADIWGANRPNRFTKAQQKHLLASSSWFVRLPEVAL